MIFQLLIVNTGDTPAVIMNYNIGTILVPKDSELPPRFNYPRPDLDSNTPVGNGITIVFDDLTDGRELSDEDNVAIRGGRSRLYCIGHVEYIDTSANPRVRRTNFCRVLEIPKNPRSYLDIGRFRVWPDPDYEYQD